MMDILFDSFNTNSAEKRTGPASDALADVASLAQVAHTAHTIAQLRPDSPTALAHVLLAMDHSYFKDKKKSGEVEWISDTLLDSVRW